MLKIHSAKESQLIHWRRITTYIQYSVNEAHFTRICLQKNLIQVHIKKGYNFYYVLKQNKKNKH